MKRRTVLWLSQQDYDYLSTVAIKDGDTKNRSMHVLLGWLVKQGVTSFRAIDGHLAPRQPCLQPAPSVEKRHRPIEEVHTRVA
jgi:hypothetical protein